MDLDDIKKHWDSNAKEHKTSLDSTTKTSTIKRLEIYAFFRFISQVCKINESKTLLEVGCGNGHNIFGLAERLPNFNFHGIDYSDDMILAANEKNKIIDNKNLSFEVGDALEISLNSSSTTQFDFVITDRLLINLNTWELQQVALKQLFNHVTEGGYLIFIENFIGSYGNQNTLREIINLPARTPDPYNKFMEEDLVESFIVNDMGMNKIYSENFGSLHDLMLYVLIPHISGGKVNYDHPLMESVTLLLENLSEETTNCFGEFGQNRLYAFKK